jgi:SNF2 domain-containing protein/helicase-like protein/SNF2 helicase associated protein
MYLTNKFSSRFTGGVRSRGQSYFRQGLVQIVEGTKQTVNAVVAGSEEYDVLLAIRGRDLCVACSCPYFDNDVCKHIWATMAAAERKGYLTGAPSRLMMVDLDFELDDSDFGLGDADYDGYEDEDYRSEDRGARAVIHTSKARESGRAQAARPPPPPEWKQQIDSISRSMSGFAHERAAAWPSTRELFYIVEGQFPSNPGLVITLGFREMKRTGEWGKLRTSGLPALRMTQLPDADRDIIALLMGSTDYYSYSLDSQSARPSYKLYYPVTHLLMPMICETGRCRVTLAENGTKPEMLPLEWDAGEPWEFWVEVRQGADNTIIAAASLRRGQEQMDISEPLMIKGGLVVARGRVARFTDFGALEWLNHLRTHGQLTVPQEDADRLLEEVFRLPRLPRLDLPEELKCEEQAFAPQPCLKISKLNDRAYWQRDQLQAELSFNYSGVAVNEHDEREIIFIAAQKSKLLRDREQERACADRLTQIGFQRSRSYYDRPPQLFLNAQKLPKVVRTLAAEGWHVEAEGNIYREPGEFRIEVTSGIDWFELHGTVEFGDTTATLPELLAALKRGETTIVLDDGALGLLPEEWLKKYGLLASLGRNEADHLRFTRSQVGLLDALLASQPEASFDESFGRACEELRSFEGVKPADAPSGFTGKLRGYQRDGLGWLQFLERFGFGGCLADDMGLGKTVQVLALLESRRSDRENPNNGAAKSKRKKAGVSGDNGRIAPSLVVVPKSLVFNWIQEAARFTPKLRVLDHTGLARLKTCDHFGEYDLIITTYGTLRRDAVQFKDVQFGHVILDEAQAIKNANTESAKAARLLRGNHRLAMSGTPIENHLGELWSLFEFLNPGLLGAASVFKLNTSAARNPDEHTRTLLSKALRPFILRRTKQQVASDLPPKTEQTIYCELESVQRKLYDELREHYRRSLLGLIDREGIKRSKIQILEALLRLRQAACHPGLIDKSRKHEPSAKLDLLLPQVGEVIDEGHKALVFSQFTSLLAIVRDRLDREGIIYEYLDGKTRDRQTRVERFQNDGECKLFLISLKAGGLGLNLTAAEYVFLLDPWWNPAVEAQAIDRAHRIGQSRHVFAYRLIARDTVEEKVLLLQKTKKDLADAIINADNSLIRNIGREDLELLLS